MSLSRPPGSLLCCWKYSPKWIFIYVWIDRANMWKPCSLQPIRSSINDVVHYWLFPIQLTNPRPVSPSITVDPSSKSNPIIPSSWVSDSVINYCQTQNERFNIDLIIRILGKLLKERGLCPGSISVISVSWVG